MKNKLLKIGTLITVLSILFVQLDVRGSGPTTYTICGPSTSTPKIGKNKEVKTPKGCGSCAMSANPVSESYDADGNLQGYIYAGTVVSEDGDDIECKSDINGSQGCSEVTISTSPGLCADVFIPLDWTGTGEGTGTGEDTGTGTF